MEEIVYIIGWNKLYQIDSVGNVFSNHKNRFLSPDKVSGYLRVTLCNNKKQLRQLVHRLVAITFIDNPENKPCVNHKNGIKTDNRIENLEWCTYSENERHSHDCLNKKIIHSKEAKLKMSLSAKGRDMTKLQQISAKNRKGKPAYNVVPVLQISLNTNEVIQEYESVTTAAINNHMFPASISNVLTNRAKTAGGFKWAYKHRS